MQHYLKSLQLLSFVVTLLFTLSFSWIPSECSEHQLPKHQNIIIIFSLLLLFLSRNQIGLVHSSLIRYSHDVSVTHLPAHHIVVFLIVLYFYLFISIWIQLFHIITFFNSVIRYSSARFASKPLCVMCVCVCVCLIWTKKEKKEKNIQIKFSLLFENNIRSEVPQKFYLFFGLPLQYDSIWC